LAESAVIIGNWLPTRR